jgi:nucleotide-binding universal stress UspA family protein|tara:strand:+ start:971 stop:1447 length:477 start_codon:yes stop_codon:yes gene_type:complete
MKHRSKFLVIVDDSEELRVAVRFASIRAANTKGGIILLKIIEHSDPQHWQSVEEIILQEARDEAQEKLKKWSKVINDLSGITPELCIKEGIASEKIIEILEEDDAVRFLVLAASSGDQPGPLVSLLAGQKSGKLPVPIVIVPQDLSDEAIDDLASRAK